MDLSAYSCFSPEVHWTFVTYSELLWTKLWLFPFVSGEADIEWVTALTMLRDSTMLDEDDTLGNVVTAVK